MSPSHIKTSAFWCPDAMGWPKELLEHPVMDWMRDFEQAFDFGDIKTNTLPNSVTDDFVFVGSDGKPGAPGAQSWAMIRELYAPFSAHYHEPRLHIIWETETGYMLMGSAWLFANFPVPREGAGTVRDLEGREWDWKGLGGFTFEYVKDPSGPKGMKMKMQTLTADSLGMVVEVTKRGMATFEEVSKKVEEASKRSV